MKTLKIILINILNQNNVENLAKCTGENCKVKHTCNRFTAPANEYYQNYIKLPVIDGKREMYWSIAVVKNHQEKKTN